MKKFAYVIAALAAAFAVSCTKETPLDTPNTDAPAEVGMKEVTITASIDPETKTSYDATGAFSWHKGDQISVMGTDKIFYTLTAQSSGASTTFRGMVPEGVTLRKEAFFPADPGIKRVESSYFFNTPEYKDLTATNSADLPMGAYSGTDNYVFKHVTGAALFTFTNFPSNVVAAEVTFANKYVKLHGEFETYTSSDLWTWDAKDINADKTDGTYIRKVSVENGQTQVYLPYPAGGTIWNEIAVKVVGFTADGKELDLLNTETSQLPAFERAVVNKMAPLALPEYVDLDGVDWNASEVATFTMTESHTSFIQWTELKAVADAKYLYVRLTAPKATWESNYIDYYFGDANSTESAWLWSDPYEYKSERSQVTDFEFGMTYNGKPVTVKKTEDGENVVWALAFPRNAHSITTNSGTVKIGFHACVDWTDKGLIPYAWGEKLAVTLP